MRSTGASLVSVWISLNCREAPRLAHLVWLARRRMEPRCKFGLIAALETMPIMRFFVSIASHLNRENYSAEPPRKGAKDLLWHSPLASANFTPREAFVKTYRSRSLS